MYNKQLLRGHNYHSRVKSDLLVQDKHRKSVCVQNTNMLPPAWDKLHAALKKLLCGQLMQDVFREDDDIHTKQTKLQELFRHSELDVSMVSGVFEELPLECDDGERDIFLQV